MKDGRTRLAHKLELGVEMESGAVAGVTVQSMAGGDSASLPVTLDETQRQLASLKIEPEEVVADKGYHSNASNDGLGGAGSAELRERAQPRPSEVEGQAGGAEGDVRQPSSHPRQSRQAAAAGARSIPCCQGPGFRVIFGLCGVDFRVDGCRRSGVFRTQSATWPSSGPNRFRGPIPVRSHQRIGEDHELAHHRAEGNHGFLSGGRELLVLAAQVGIELPGGQGRHVQGLPNPAAPALQVTPSSPGSGIACHRSHAGEACRRLGVKSAELRHLGQEGGRRHRAHARDGGQDRDAPRQFFFIFAELGDARIDPFQMTLGVSQTAGVELLVSGSYR